MLHALLYKDKLIGLFTDLKKCILMQKGLDANNFAKMVNMKIISYHDNSITICDSEDEEEDNNIIETFTTDDTTDSENFISTDKLDSDKQKTLKKQRDKKIKCHKKSS